MLSANVALAKGNTGQSLEIFSHCWIVSRCLAYRTSRHLADTRNRKFNGTDFVTAAVSVSNVSSEIRQGDE
jgi:hypothetical protein